MSSNDFATWYKAQLFEKRTNAGEVAGKARISRAASYFYTNGSRVPSPETVAKIAAALGVPADQVPTFTPKINPTQNHLRQETAQ